MTDVVLDLLPVEVGGGPRDQALYALTLSVLVLGTLLCALALWLRRIDVVGVAVAAAGAGGWLLANSANEGTVLYEVQPGNGFTQADLVVLPAGVLVLLLCLQRLRGR